MRPRTTGEGDCRALPMRRGASFHHVSLAAEHAEVLRAQARPSLGHTEAEFCAIFGRALRNLREVFLCEKGQPFIMAGSGTLAMEFAASNFVERGDRAVVVNTGWFSERYADQNEQDYQAFAEAVRAGKLEAVEGV